MDADHQQLICDNPDAFSREFTRRLPTSVDLLRSDSPLLESIARLPTPQNVRRHTIYGSYRRMLGAGDSDGVVPVTSARQNGVESEACVNAKHVQIHKHQDGINEVLRILSLHQSECGGQRVW